MFLAYVFLRDLGYLKVVSSQFDCPFYLHLDGGLVHDGQVFFQEISP